MGKLGRKFGHKFRKLGHKFDNSIHKLGQKTNNVLDKIEKKNNQIIDSSGKGLRVADKILSKADKIVGSLNDAGIQHVPLLGDATSLIGDGIHDASKGVHKANKLREKYKTVSNNAIGSGRNSTASLEKMNSRKTLAKLARDDSRNDGFH